MNMHTFAPKACGVALCLVASIPTTNAQSSAPYVQAGRIPFENNLAHQSLAAADTRLIRTNDLNADGKPDFAVLVSGLLQAIGNVGDGTLTVLRQWSMSFGASAIAAGDVDGDGRSDLVFGGINELGVLLNSESGLSPGTDHTLTLDSVGPNARVTDVALADFDGDGKLDVAAVDTDPLNDARFYNVGSSIVRHRESIVIAWGQNDGTFVRDAARPRLRSLEFPSRVRVDDINEDGRPELLIGGADSLILHFNPAAGGIAASSHPVLFGVAPVHADVYATATGHLNPDNLRDLVALYYYQTATPQGTRFRLRPYRTSTHPQIPYVFNGDPPEIPLPHAPTTLALADFNSDGHQDLIVGLEAAGDRSIALYAGRGDFTFEAPLYINGGFDAGELVVADINGDSKPDILVIDCTHPALVVFLHT